MACDISSGRTLKCKTVGGVKNIYFINYISNFRDDISVAGTLFNITSISPTPTAYKFELRGSQGMNTTNEASRDNGTNFYTSTGTFKIGNVDTSADNLLYTLSNGNPQMIVEDYNGGVWLYGMENGCDVSVNRNLGASMSDGTNYEVTVTTIERQPPYDAELNQFTII